MRTLFLKNEELTDESGKQRIYDYYITIDEVDVGPYVCEGYGVRIAERGGMQATVRSITNSIERIDELCELLIRGKVTPTTLADVVSDWL